MIEFNKVSPLSAGANVYLVATENGLLLIDAGHRHKSDSILKQIKKLGFDPKKIKLIVLTHTHYDHVGSLASLKKKTDADILVHLEEAECIREGFTPLPKGTNNYSRFIVFLGRTFFRRISKYKPVEPTIAILHHYDLEKYGFRGKVVPTPGHTHGSLSVFFDWGEAVVGDTLFNITPKTIFPPFADDCTKLLQSWQLLLDSQCDAFYPGHGKKITRETLLRNYKIYAERFPSE